MPASPSTDRGLKPVTVGVRTRTHHLPDKARLGPADQHFVNVPFRAQAGLFKAVLRGGLGGIDPDSPIRPS